MDFVCKNPRKSGIKLFFLTWRLFLLFIFIFFGSPGTTPDAPIGLWTLSPRFSAVLSPRSIFPTGQRFPLPNHVTSGSGHFRSCDFLLSLQAPLSNQNGQRLPFRLATVRTNQKPGNFPYGRTLLLSCYGAQNMNSLIYVSYLEW